MSIQEDWRDPQAVKPGMSKTTKVLLILAGVGCVFGLLCCGGVGFFAWKFRNSFSDDPVVARKVQSDIVSIDIPAEFQPIGSVDFVFMKGVAYKGKNEKSIIMLGEFKAPGDPKDQMEQMQLQFRQGLRKGNDKAEQNFEVESRESHTFTIRGTEVSFEFEKGKMKPGDEESLRVSGTFPSNGGAGALFLMVPAEDYDEDDIKEMIESIK